MVDNINVVRWHLHSDWDFQRDVILMCLFNEKTINDNYEYVRISRSHRLFSVSHLHCINELKFLKCNSTLTIDVMNAVVFHDDAGHLLKLIAIILFIMLSIRLCLMETIDVFVALICDIAGILAIFIFASFVVIDLFTWPIISCFS